MVEDVRVRVFRVCFEILRGEVRGWVDIGDTVGIELVGVLLLVDGVDVVGDVDVLLLLLLLPLLLVVVRRELEGLRRRKPILDW